MNLSMNLLLTLTNDDLKDDLDIDDSNDRDTIMREILKLRESSRSYKKFYGAGNVGDVNKVPKQKLHLQKIYQLLTRRPPRRTAVKSETFGRH